MFIIPQFVGEGTPHKQRDLDSLSHGEAFVARRRFLCHKLEALSKKELTTLEYLDLDWHRLHSVLWSSFQLWSQENVIHMLQGLMCLWEDPQICNQYGHHALWLIYPILLIFIPLMLSAIWVKDSQQPQLPHTVSTICKWKTTWDEFLASVFLISLLGIHFLMHIDHLILWCC